MVVPLAPSQRRARAGRVHDRARGRRAVRWAIQVLLIAGALLGIATPALAATHPATNTTHQVVLTAHLTPAAPTAPGGVCQVPGIGDIGGLVGLCSQGSAGILGDLNNICEPSLPQPEQATGGIDNMVQPPAAAAGGKTLYDNYGVAGQFWAAHGLQCSDMTSLIGNNVAGIVFDAAKSIDRVTITVYQSAAGNNILTWLQDAVNKLITALGNAIYFPYLAPVVILGAIWLAWQPNVHPLVEVLRQKKLPVGCVFGQVTSPGLRIAIFERSKEQCCCDRTAYNDDGGCPKSNTHRFLSCDFGRTRGRVGG